MPDSPPNPSPYAGLDYRPELTPSTASLGPLAQSMAQLVGVGGMTALAAAILLDQGRATDALDLLGLEVERLAAEREAAQAERRQRP